MLKPRGYYHRDNVCEVNRELVLALANQGATLAEIKNRIGTGRTRIREFLRRNGVTRSFSKARRAEQHGNWNGGRHIDKDGYVLVYCPDHPFRRKDKPYVLEHRRIMEKHLGRYLDPPEVVHHRNKDTQDNRIENLELFSANGEHLAHELKGHCPNWSESGHQRLRELWSQRRASRQSRNLPKEA